jgi:glycosyltransferase EpsF
LRRTYKRLSQSLLRIAANTRLAVSRAAAADLFGAAESVEILPCGFALEPYLNLNRTCDPGIFTLVQVGRLVPEKNHIHSLRLLKQLLRRGVSARLLVVGDGPLRPGLESACTCFGLTKNVEFLGAVPDPWRALSCADLALFPSHYEGLGLAALEAQAAGVPVLCAAHLPPEIDLIPGLLHRLALDLPIAEWAQKAMQLRFIPAPAKETRERQFLASPYSFSSNIRHLEQIYAA